jgi:hypothetical protein
MGHVIWSAFAILLLAVWLVAEFRSCVRTRIALGLACVGIVATAWIRAELRITRLDAMRDEYGRWIWFYTEYGDPEKVQRAADVLRHSDPRQFEEFNYWAEEDKIVPQVQKLGGWATPCDRLDFGECPISDAGARYLGDCPELKWLFLNRARISDKGLASLKDLTCLEILRLEHTPITDEGLVHLSGLVNLRELDIAHTKVTDEGFVHLSGLVNLRDLDVADTEVAGEGFRFLGKLSVLSVLSASRTNVTNANISYLLKLPGLQKLYLGRTQISDAAVPYLTKLTGLQSLWVAETRITAERVAELRQALPNCDVRY